MQSGKRGQNELTARDGKRGFTMLGLVEDEAIWLRPSFKDVLFAGD